MYTFSSLLEFLRTLKSFVLLFFGHQKRMGDDKCLVNINKKAFDWCKECIGGTWSTLTEDEFQISPLSGGMTNYLYICSLPNEITVLRPDEPRKVLLRVYGHLAKTSAGFVVRNSVIFAILSEKCLGPKLYGAFPDGRLEEYIPARCLSRTDLLNPIIFKSIATKLGYFHTLEMPLCKRPKWLYDVMHMWLSEIKEAFLLNGLWTQEDLRKFLPKNLEKEMHDLMDSLEKINSPVVFCHNDLQEGNVLILDSCDDPVKKLTVIDWEYCAYNYRGFDLGNHFLEWCYDYNVDEPPYFAFCEESYPSKKTQYEFFEAYLASNSKSEITEQQLKTLYVEANSFALASHFMWGLWSLVQSRTSEINFGYLEYALNRFDQYRRMKQLLPSLLEE
ncbi:choline/ethanolamine kinase-like isoform X1 [Argonauta hians]